MILDAYRSWLTRQRKYNRPWFRAYEAVANTAAGILRPAARPPKPKPLLAPAHRFDAATPITPDAWSRVFASLAKPASGSPPRISILTPAWNTRPEWFCSAAVSMLDQTCPDWEWIVVDDGSTDPAYHPYAERLAAACGGDRFRFHKLGRNCGISGATNDALGMARAEFVCLLDHDDLLHPDAIRLCLERFSGDDVDAVYTDSDKVAGRGGERSEPFHKPAWSPEYFLGVMYVGHLLCVRRDLALRIGGFDPRFDGVQDFEFFLRYTEQCPGRIEHIPEILYHWRRAEGSLATAADAKDRIGPLQQSAVQEHLQRTGRNAFAQPGPSPHRVSIAPGPRRTHPLVTIVIPTRDAPDILVTCLDSIRQGSTYPELQIVCADNDTVDPDALRKMAEPGIERVPCPGPFNFSKINNRAIREAARGEFLVLLNNDIEVLTPGWIEEMLQYAELPDVGVVGPLLLYPDDRTVQHAGVVLGFRGTADHVMRGFPENSDGYAGSLPCAREVSAVTGACLMVRRSLYDQVGGLNEHYQVLYQDVDFCLRLRRDLGLRNLFTPRARLLHHESRTRKNDYNLLDRALFIDTWDGWISCDPYYSPHFSREFHDYRL